MVSRRFTVMLAVRLLAVGLAMAAVIGLLLRPGHPGGLLLASMVLVATIAELWRYVTRSNRELARFHDAARYADFSQRFNLEGVGSGFDELGRTFADILDRLRDVREQSEASVRYQRAIIEHTPIPLLTLKNDDSIALLNNAARRLFGATEITRRQDLIRFGKGFHDAVIDAVPGRRELVTFTVEDIEYKLTLAVAEIVTSQGSEKLISLQDIQTELDATQADAWHDLVRVLTHEIMNSITPITSLAVTAETVVDDIIKKTDADSPIGDDLVDLHDAIDTVAQRSDSLLNFVDSYRQLTRLAPGDKQRIAIRELFASAARLAGAENPQCVEWLTCEVTPPGLDVFADRDLLEPVLSNLLRNAWQAVESEEEPSIELHGRLNARGNVVIEVSDNGPGVADELANRIFVPFFTTKEKGSGVGLALARQVMIAQGGFIRLGRSEAGGAKFSLIF